MHSKFVKQVLIFRKYISLVLISCLIFTACTKQDEPLTPEQQVVQYLTGVGNRFWRIKEVYVNKVQVILNPTQLNYNKTYTLRISTDGNSGTFADSDGSFGLWELKTATRIMETITNNVSGPVLLNLTINHLDTNNMDVEYTANGQTVRTVYFAY